MQTHHRHRLERTTTRPCSRWRAACSVGGTINAERTTKSCSAYAANAGNDRQADDGWARAGRPRRHQDGPLWRPAHGPHRKPELSARERPGARRKPRARHGRPISQFDARVVAITRSFGAALATRNVSG